jgi:hypothetical protein
VLSPNFDGYPLDVDKTRENNREERDRVKEHYRQLYIETSALLYRHDPIGINFEINPDEYEPEVGTILPRLDGCRSVEDVQRVVYEEFRRWFASSAGSYEKYSEVASELWEVWKRHSVTS